jgi:hypothetical protein
MDRKQAFTHSLAHARGCLRRRHRRIGLETDPTFAHTSSIITLNVSLRTIFRRPGHAPCSCSKAAGAGANVSLAMATLAAAGATGGLGKGRGGKGRDAGAGAGVGADTKLTVYAPVSQCLRYVRHHERCLYL